MAPLQWQANIGCQGRLSADLGDILAGVDYLRTVEGLRFGDQVGIFGGSYGRSSSAPARHGPVCRDAAMSDTFQVCVGQ